MDRPTMVRGTRTMGDTQFLPKGAMPRYVRQMLFDDLIEFEREVVSGRYNIETYFNAIGLFLSYKGVSNWNDLFKDVYLLDRRYAKTASKFLSCLEQTRNLDEAIEFVASGFTDIDLFRNATIEELMDTSLTTKPTKGLFRLV